ncbi:hypothetical protein J2045_003252 [Peteryoungia aggregata LMG 23059]|uniref:Uncharacterized protein n=1 Tax=Peteryoungia aggregata LMG 23059 TaxID=1368425 RepID=A0ABU0GA23_9HYPH|nr:hypothetical protein [Peteryoungia aggregata LMG 23059]
MRIERINIVQKAENGLKLVICPFADQTLLGN